MKNDESLINIFKGNMKVMKGLKINRGLSITFIKLDEYGIQSSGD